MNRRVERKHLDKWLSENYPNAVTKLSNKSGVSANSINKIRLGRVPKNHDVRKQLSRALGVSEEALFPSGDADEEHAS